MQNRFINLEEYILSSSVGALNYATNLENRFELDSNKKLLSSTNNEFRQKEVVKTQKLINEKEMKLSPLDKEGKLKISNFYKRLIELF